MNIWLFADSQFGTKGISAKDVIRACLLHLRSWIQSLSAQKNNKEIYIPPA